MDSGANSIPVQMENEQSIEPVQLSLPLEIGHLTHISSDSGNRSLNSTSATRSHDRVDFHDWYRFVLGFPPGLVQACIEEFDLNGDTVVLDPFCGTGTTLVECKRRQIPSIGLETNPFARFASSVKVDWGIDPDQFDSQADRIVQSTQYILDSEGIGDDGSYEGELGGLPLRTLPPDKMKLLVTNSMSPLPLHKSLILQEQIEKNRGALYYKHAVLAFANTLLFGASNLVFGPEVGVGRTRSDVPVTRLWLEEVRKMTAALRRASEAREVEARVLEEDARDVQAVLDPLSINAVITSPPYPNEKDYTRTTRLESVILGFINSNAELRSVKKRLIRSNTRGVYKADNDDRWSENFPEVDLVARLIEQRRLDLGKNSGFERLYGRVTRLYFGGMARHLAQLRSVLSPGAMLAYVVGDQASYLKVKIRTGQMLAVIAQAMGYELVSVDLFRTRRATATRERLREEVLVLRWPERAVD